MKNLFEEFPFLKKSNIQVQGEHLYISSGLCSRSACNKYCDKEEPGEYLIPVEDTLHSELEPYDHKAMFIESFIMDEDADDHLWYVTFKFKLI